MTSETKFLLLTIPKFARATGLSVWLVRRSVQRGDIPSVRVGPRQYIDARLISRWTRSSTCTRPKRRNVGPVLLRIAAEGIKNPQFTETFLAAAESNATA